MKQLSSLSIVLLLLGLLPVALPEGSAPVNIAEAQQAKQAPVQPPRTLTALVGVGQDTTQVLAFFPSALKVRVGDTITWKIESDEVHTVSVIRGVKPQEATIEDPWAERGTSSPLSMPAGRRAAQPRTPRFTRRCFFLPERRTRRWRSTVGRGSSAPGS